MSTSEPIARSRLGLGAALRPHLLLIAVLGVLFGALAGTAAALLPAEYVATGKVLIQPLVGNPYSPDTAGSDLTRLETEAQVVSSDVIVDAVRDDLPSGHAVNLTQGLIVSIPANTQIIQIGFRAPDADTATAVASQFATNYLDYRTERRDTYVRNREAGINEQLDNLSEKLDNLREKGDRTAEVTAITAQMQNLRLQLSTLETTDSIAGQVISEPRAKASGIAVPVWAAATGGVLLGALIGAVIAVARERRRDVLRTVDDVESLGVPVLGHLAGSRRHVDSTGSPGQLSDASLMVAALLTRRVAAPAAVAVGELSSASASTNGFASDLAWALTQGRQRVLLIDGNSEEASSAEGLSDALLRSGKLGPLTQTDGELARLSVGQDPKAGRRLYGTPRLDAVLTSASEAYDWVVVEAPATDQTDGRALVGGCGYWVPIVTLGSTSRHDLENGLQWAHASGAHPLGAVAVDPAYHPARGAQDAGGASSSE